MEIVHGICKYPNGDESPLYWSIWIPYNTPCGTDPGRDAFIFYHCANFWNYIIYFLPCIFLLEAVTYQHNLMMKFCEWGCTYPEYLGSHILQFVKPLLHPAFLIYYFWIFYSQTSSYFWKLLWKQGYWSILIFKTRPNYALFSKSNGARVFLKYG